MKLPRIIENKPKINQNGSKDAYSMIAQRFLSKRVPKGPQGSQKEGHKKSRKKQTAGLPRMLCFSLFFLFFFVRPGVPWGVLGGPWNASGCLWDRIWLPWGGLGEAFGVLGLTRGSFGFRSAARERAKRAERLGSLSVVKS